MYRPKAIPAIRLAKILDLPTADDVERCMGEAAKMRGRSVELPWLSDRQIGDLAEVICVLSVIWGNDDEEPTWSFHKGDRAPRETRWSHQTRDLGLIASLVQRECLGQEVDLAPAANSMLAGPQQGAPHMGGQEAEKSGTANRLGFAEAEKQPTRAATLEGELLNMKVPNLLQSISMGKMTGALSVAHNETIIEIYVEDGNPVHASSSDCKGEAAIMELLTWDVGKFQFFPNERTTERSVVKRLDNILMESAPLIDQFRFLNQTGVTLSSYLICKHPNISEMEFEQRITRGARTDLLKQKQFYQVLDNESNLFELLRKMPLAKVDWIPCVYNLVVCDLVAVSSMPAQSAKSLPIEAMGFDRSAIQIAMKSIYRTETGLMNYPVILYFLEQEFFRWQHTTTPFSVLTFEMCRRTPTGIEPLSILSIREAAKRIDTIKRNVDCLSHFETFGFLLLMPFTRVQAAALVARRITEVLWDKSLGGDLDSSNLALAFGVAGIPEDCQDLGLLLAAAKQAMGLSKQTGTSVVTFQSGQRG